MKQPTMLKIGEFARIGQVSIATLRYYDQCGLLKPDTLDQETGYRYYTFDQLPRLNRILALKDLGFSLEQITHLLEDSLSLQQLREMFVHQQAQVQRMIETEQMRLTRLAARLRQIEQEEEMPEYEIVLKQVEPVLVASLRSLVPMGKDLGQAYTTLLPYLETSQAQYTHPTVLVLHSRYQWYEDVMAIDVEATVPILAARPENNSHEQIRTRTLAGGLMASTIHIGDDPLLGQAFAALYRWLNDVGYQLISPPRLLRLQRAPEMDRDQHITEVQFPVRSV